MYIILYRFNLQYNYIMVPGEDGDKTMPPSTHHTADKCKLNI